MSTNPTKQISRRHFNKTLTPKSHWSCLSDAFYLILADNYWVATLIPEISDSVDQVNVTIIRNIYNHHHLPNNCTGANILWLDAFVVAPSVKNFEVEQLNSSTFPVFPRGIKNSRRFPVFLGVVDTLLCQSTDVKHLTSSCLNPLPDYGAIHPEGPLTPILSIILISLITN